MQYEDKDIIKLVESDTMVRLNLKLRVPVYGKVVKLNDFEDLLSKNMFRFVMSGRLDAFNEAQTDYRKAEHTKIMSIKEITYIKNY